MRIALIIILAIHGIIHLFGFLKAFGIAKFDEVSNPISKPYGIVWLIAFILFTASLILLLAWPNYWWIIGVSALSVSQCLIIIFWKDAKFGTVLNLLILAFILIASSTFNLP